MYKILKFKKSKVFRVRNKFNIDHVDYEHFFIHYFKLDIQSLQKQTLQKLEFRRFIKAVLSFN